MAVQSGAATFQGTGTLQARFVFRHSGAATFQGAGTFSGVDTIIQAQVFFLSQSYLQAIADRSLAELVGNPKARLIIAVEIDIIALDI